MDAQQAENEISLSNPEETASFFLLWGRIKEILLPMQRSPANLDLLAMKWDPSGELDRDHHRWLLHRLVDKHDRPTAETLASSEAAKEG